MAKDHHLIASFIFLLLSDAGSRAEDTVYVQTGASVHLDIQRDQLPADIEELIWQNGKADTIVKYYNNFKIVKDYDDFKDRVEFNNKTFSLTLKNMQKNDSGIYTAKIIGKYNKDITVYTVYVIDAVKAPVLTVMYEWSSSDSCTVNVTCRGHDLTLNSSYNNGRCSPEEVTSPEKHTLTLICSEESIICNHSNPVSSKTDKRDIKQLCERIEISTQPVPSHTSFTTIHLLFLIVVVATGVILFCGLFLYCCCRNEKDVQEEDIIDYDDVEKQMLEDTWTTVIYHTAGKHHKP